MEPALMTKEEGRMEAALIKKYAQLSAYIYKYCKKLGCAPRSKRLGWCCDRYQCECTRDDAESLGVKLEFEPDGTFIRNGRCIVPPHLRRICAVHACDRIQALAGPRFMEHFLALRDEICALELGTAPDRVRSSKVCLSQVLW